MVAAGAGGTCGPQRQDAITAKFSVVRRDREEKSVVAICRGSQHAGAMNPTTGGFAGPVDAYAKAPTGAGSAGYGDDLAGKSTLENVRHV